jgi:Spy/CpxP family protein refolding chaperone
VEKRKLIATVLMIFLLAGSGILFAQKPKRQAGEQGQRVEKSERWKQHQMRRGARMLEFLAQRLQITDEQRTQIQSVLQTERTLLEPHMQTLRQAREQLREATRDGVYDENQVRAIVQQQTQALGELLVARHRVEAQIYEILTPAQQEELEQLRGRFERHLTRMFGR